MIHDILLSCLNLHSKRLPIQEFVVSDAVSAFLHPCEIKIMDDIIKIVNLLRNVAKFSKIYGANQNSTNIVETDIEPLQTGLYLKAFVNGIDDSLDDYVTEISDLERRYIQNPTHSLLFIYQKLQEYEPLATYLTKLIRGIRMYKLHGCTIVQYIQKNSLHGDARIYKAMKTIQASVNAIFLKQLTHWILYAKLIDSYGEFFIQSSETHNESATESEKGTSIGSSKHTTTSLSEAASNYADIWRYEICYDLLPQYLSSSWAEKVLFIGQTVLIFKVNSHKSNKGVHTWNKTENNLFKSELSLWNEKEHIYFTKIQDLQNDIDLNVSHYERVIDEIKLYVTTRLSEIAINQADLVQQLRLVKDFYLIGRGELFLEFIRQTYIINKSIDDENRVRDFVKAFECAAQGVGVTEDLEQFSLCIPKTNLDVDESTHEFGFFQLIQLQYKINWPLHLLFSPKVIERYNVLFRFLLLIKKMQYDLHMIWYQHTRESKANAHKANQSQIIHLRNQLMFFVDNLQYYIQVDVLESQYSILMNTILNKADFEQIQRAHSIFQANVLSLCFLLTDENTSKTNILHSTTLHSSNPVYLIINEIFHICEDFCNLKAKGEGDEHIDKSINELDERFGGLIEQLINLLVGLKAAPCTTPLSQLLLRLDFNHWFSIRRKRESS
ncbi:gamma-tubulin complex component 4 homolog isoform X2 [Glossina fuscipes]|uniref:Gamma-tubulin complex component n=1 Tax=Glossina fuscipes TaxID=7396 RepID=A0A8U0WCN7_9MUSC|nr:gamma-tubulin complex component 4 homolog isoform X2 [Glossina fuscipes]